MTQVSIVRDKEGFIWEFTVKGHAGAGAEGEDIVCAGISAIVQTALGAMDELAGVRSFTVKRGLVRCTVPADIPKVKKEVIKIILDSMAIGLKQIDLTPEYSEYISILDKEV
jgi:uncharacterized protein